MAFKFSASEAKRLADLMSRFEEARDRLAEFLADCASASREKFDDKSDRWRESDAGQEAEEWLISLEAMAEEVGCFEIDLSQVES